MYVYLPERVMYQFGPFVVRCRDLDAMLKNLDSHLVPENYRQVSALIKWACADGYIALFYRVSNPIMTPDSPGRQLRSSNHEVLETKDDHTQHVCSISQRIMDMARSSIKVRLLCKASP